MAYTLQQGKAAEDFVADHLMSNRFTIHARNYRKRDGEIDLIAGKSDLMIFVEVKMREDNYFDLSTVITPSKQRKIIAVAKEYIAHLSYAQRTYRFDVALVQGTKHRWELSYIPNAFNEGDCTW